MCYCTPEIRTPVCKNCPEEMRKEWGIGQFKRPKKEEPYVPMVGDRVSLEGEIVDSELNSNQKMWTIRFNNGPGSNGVAFYDWEIKEANIKLLSRKPPRKITRKEIEEMVGGSFELID